MTRIRMSSRRAQTGVRDRRPAHPPPILIVQCSANLHVPDESMAWQGWGTAVGASAPITRAAAESRMSAPPP
jgi:hypothetical protein